jgi:hypothetical protein
MANNRAIVLRHCIEIRVLSAWLMVVSLYAGFFSDMAGAYVGFICCCTLWGRTAAVGDER